MISGGTASTGDLAIARRTLKTATADLPRSYLRRCRRITQTGDKRGPNKLTATGRVGLASKPASNASANHGRDVTVQFHSDERVSTTMDNPETQHRRMSDRPPSQTPGGGTPTAADGLAGWHRARLSVHCNRNFRQTCRIA